MFFGVTEREVGKKGGKKLVLHIEIKVSFFDAFYIKDYRNPPKILFAFCKDANDWKRLKKTIN